jgi:hypothetical protein
MRAQHFSCFIGFAWNSEIDPKRANSQGYVMSARTQVCSFLREEKVDRDSNCIYLGIPLVDKKNILSQEINIFNGTDGLSSASANVSPTLANKIISFIK